MGRQGEMVIKMAIDKSTWNKKIKVSQSTINEVKALGMKEALKLAKINAGAYQGGLVAEYQEATRRLYGDRRFGSATGAKPPVKKGATFGESMKPKAPAKKAATFGSTMKPKAPAKKGPTLADKIKKK